MNIHYIDIAADSAADKFLGVQDSYGLVQPVEGTRQLLNAVRSFALIPLAVYVRSQRTIVV